MIVFAYLGIVLCGALCIGVTIYEHKKIKQKNIDTELYNQSLEVQRDFLIKQSEELDKKIKEQKEESSRLLNSIQLLYEQDEDLTKDQEILKNIINDLTEQKQKIEESLKETTVKNNTLAEQNDQLIARMDTLKRTIEDLSSSQKAMARASFEQYCDALEYEYKKVEEEFDENLASLDTLYFNRMQELIADESDLLEEQRKDLDALRDLFFKKQETMNKEHQEEEKKLLQDLSIVREELEKIRATKAAAMEAQLREQEIKDRATFYTLQLNEADRRDVAYLQSIEFNLREARPLRMLIWSTFYRDKVNDLAARVGAIGASGIYKITHIDSGISYIGQAKDIKERWITHVKCSLGIDTPVTSQLYAFTREKGIDNFTFEVLEKCSITELNEKEKFYIDLYQTYDFGLNANRGVNK